MATSYNIIERQVALRINAILGTQQTDLQTNYAVTPLTTAQYNSTIFIQQSVRDAMLNTEGRLCDAIASTGNHPLRAYLISQTAPLANQAELPNLDVNNEQIIGVWGSVQDSADGLVCRQMSLAQIQRKNRSNLSGRQVIPVYWFFMDDLRVFHTRASVTAQVCVYSRTIQAAAIATNGPMLLPDTQADPLVNGTVSLLVRDDEFMQQASLYRGYFMEAEQGIRQGLSSTIPKATQPGVQPSP
jgi:hypothetical protein